MLFTKGTEKVARLLTSDIGNATLWCIWLYGVRVHTR